SDRHLPGCLSLVGGLPHLMRSDRSPGTEGPPPSTMPDPAAPLPEPGDAPPAAAPAPELPDPADEPPLAPLPPALPVPEPDDPAPVAPAPAVPAPLAEAPLELPHLGLGLVEFELAAAGEARHRGRVPNVRPRPLVGWLKQLLEVVNHCPKHVGAADDADQDA